MKYLITIPSNAKGSMKSDFLIKCVSSKFSYYRWLGLCQAGLTD